MKATVQPKVARYMSEHVGIMMSIADVSAATGLNHNSVNGALNRLSEKPGSGITSQGRGIYMYRPGSNDAPKRAVATVVGKVYEGVGMSRGGKIIVRDTDTDILYTLSDEL